MLKRIIFLLPLSLICIFSQAQDDIELIELANGLDLPVDIAHVGDDKLFIVEKTGQVRIFENGVLLADDFLNISSSVYSNQDETGLLGIAFHPDYNNNKTFFVNYTSSSSNTRISKFTTEPTDPYKADPNSEVIILEIDQPFGNHNGGCVKFGPDGYLYVGMGDGGWGGDPQDHGQNPESFLGKMLRLDVDNGTPYSIPSDNPFVSDPDTFDEIWATGLRNPWRFSFDSETGDLWIADVGQDAWEEINYFENGASSGVNYGWRCEEGFSNFNTDNCEDTYETPIFAYANNLGSGGCSVTGGFVYRGSEYPYFIGKYIYADFCTGRFWAISKSPNGDWINTALANLQNNEFSSFGEDSKGELYVLSYEAGIISKVTTQLVSTKELSLFNNLEVFPVPTNDFVYLQAEWQQAENCSLELFDISGKTLFTKELSSSNVLNEKLVIKHLDAGTYLLTIHVGDRSIAKRIIKQ